MRLGVNNALTITMLMDNIQDKRAGQLDAARYITLMNAYQMTGKLDWGIIPKDNYFKVIIEGRYIGNFFTLKEAKEAKELALIGIT